MTTNNGPQKGREEQPPPDQGAAELCNPHLSGLTSHSHAEVQAV